ncbi:DeoR/GlpR family DNA-binding transcription regulator [Candidimonas nitroreducens]|uniref:DeoR family transcriptional regulator n=1 Tax=Candidimonas nitroreducens TaxID=683354 RepID=A0A225MD00_9BURK|nr:DeoR/GlpR family DNA-binding transcription regulator [Candidimonas nitroreducens]OWT57441.1 DeoR family transcriptional regulator [Candidimonas nitroreducens]
MWAKDRHHRILSLLATREQVSVANLCEEFGVSRETLRRDIVQLESQGRLRRVHGGFTRAEDAEPAFKNRVSANSEAKRRIGAAAARLVEPGMLISVDAGTTTLAFAQFLASVLGVKILTNSLGLAATVHEGGASDVILLGGRLGSDVPGTYGEITNSQLRRFRPQIAFFSPVAINPNEGAMNFDLEEADLASTMCENAERVVVLADHSKLGNFSRIQVCACDRISTLITDKKAPQACTAQLMEAGVGDIIRV